MSGVVLGAPFVTMTVQKIFLLLHGQVFAQTSDGGKQVAKLGGCLATRRPLHNCKSMQLEKQRLNLAALRFCLLLSCATQRRSHATQSWLNVSLW